MARIGPSEFAIYKGDEFLFLGTNSECAKFMGWKSRNTVIYYASPSYHKRVESGAGNAIVVIRIEE